MAVGKLISIFVALTMLPSPTSAQGGLVPTDSSAASAAPASPADPDLEGEIILLGRVRYAPVLLRHGARPLIISRDAISGSQGVLVRAERGISPKRAYVTANASGDVTIAFSGRTRLVIRGFKKELAFITIHFSNGTEWRAQDIESKSLIASKFNTVLYSVNSNNGQTGELDPKGWARRIVGRENDDTIIYRRGYGRLTIDELDPTGPNDSHVLVLGAGILPENVKLSKTRGSDIVMSFGHGDVITMLGAMVRSDTDARGMQIIKFANGTAWSLGELRYRLAPSDGQMRVVKEYAGAPLDLDDLAHGVDQNFGFLISTPYKNFNFSVKTTGPLISGNASRFPSERDMANLFDCYISGDTSDNPIDIPCIFPKYRTSFAGMIDLAKGQYITLHFKVSISDGQGGEIDKHVNVTIEG